MWTMIILYVTFTGSTLGSSPVYTPGFSTLAACQAAGSAVTGLNVSFPNLGGVTTRGVCIQVM